MVLAIELPFSAQTFFDVFERYNSDLPYAGVFLATLAVTSAIISFTRCSKLSLAILAALWLWAGIAYHLVYFAAVNPVAYGFGLFFILQSCLFLLTALRPIESEASSTRFAAFAGAVLVTFSIAIYPLLGHLAGHSFPRNPTFGLPCPLTIYTFGILLLLAKRVPNYLMIVPLIWALIGTTASVIFGVWQDLSLLISGVIFLIIYVSVPREKIRTVS